MSSHHIVRDEQEPALILHKLGNFPSKVLHSLLEWSPTVLSCEESIDPYKSLGHKLDIVLIGFQNLTKWKKYLADQQPVKVLAMEDGFLASGLLLLQRENHQAVNLVTNDDSLDEVVRSIRSWLSVLDVVLFTETRRILVVKGGSFRKWVPAGSHLTVKSLAQPVLWQFQGVDIAESLASEQVLLKKEEGDLVIKTNQSPFLVIEAL